MESINDGFEIFFEENWAHKFVLGTQNLKDK